MIALKLRAGQPEPNEFVFPTSRGTPFNVGNVRARAKSSWEQKGLEPIGLHQLRHFYASVALASGVPVKSLAEFMGHSSVSLVFDRYGHLLRGAGSESAELMDSYLARADTGSRLSQLDVE